MPQQEAALIVPALCSFSHYRDQTLILPAPGSTWPDYSIQIPLVDTTQTNPRVEVPTSHLYGSLGLDGVIDAKNVDIFFDSGSGIT